MPLPLTVSCFSRIQIGFTILVPAHLGSPGERAVKRVCVCVWLVCLSAVIEWFGEVYRSVLSLARWQCAYCRWFQFANIQSPVNTLVKMLRCVCEINRNKTEKNHRVWWTGDSFRHLALGCSISWESCVILFRTEAAVGNKAVGMWTVKQWRWNSEQSYEGKLKFQLLKICVHTEMPVSYIMDFLTHIFLWLWSFCR